MRQVFTSRRQLLGQGLRATAALGMAAPAARALNANERISVGICGPGDRGTDLMSKVASLAASHNLEITAVCDIWNQRREAAAKLVDDWTGRRPRQCRTPDELFSLPDLDAVIIATADFQHAYLARQAILAGKDVYVEKPFGCDFEQIKQARDVVRRSDRIMQIGTQLRYKGQYWAARDFVGNGKLGKVSYIEITQALFGPRWRIPGSEHSLTEKDTNWQEFLCYQEPVPFNARHYREFRLFWPYSNGIFCQWMSHAIDLINLVFDEIPKAVTAMGGVYVWRDGRVNPDTAQCLLEYPSGCLVSYHMRLGNQGNPRWIALYGTQGTLDLEAGLAYGEGGGGEVTLLNPGSEYPEFDVNAQKRLPERSKGGEPLDIPPDEDYMEAFFEALRTRRRPKADVEAAFGHALATTMAGMSLRSGLRMEYDLNKDQVIATQPTATICTSQASDG